MPTNTSILRELRAAALPFVTRSLRGPRLKRTFALSLLLALVTAVLGAWLALGDGELERDARQVLRVESSIHVRSHEEYVHFVLDPRTLRYAERERENVRDAKSIVFTHRDNGVVGNMASLGYDTLRMAAIDAPPEHEELRARAAAVLAAHPHWQQGTMVGRTSFHWDNPRDVARVRAIVEHDLLPEVALYQSPLGPLEAIGLIGLLAGLLLTAMMTVFTPVMAGIAVAQEAHENTLLPLSGTSLSPRQIAIGLLLGSAAPVLIVAVPQLAIVLMAAVICGGLVSTLVFIALLLPTAWVLGTLAQVVGLHAGKRRGPGIIGIALLALAGTWSFTGLLLGLETSFSQSKAAVMALLPSAALVHFLRDGFLGPVDIRSGEVDPAWFTVRLVTAAVACIVVGVLALLATERRIFGRYCTPLRRGEALVGIGTLGLLTLLAGPGSSTEAWLASLAMMVLPMQILVMGRVAVGDAPAGTPRVPLGSLLGEFAIFFGIHALLATIVLGPGWLTGLQPIALVQLGWALAVAALVSIRVVAMPARLPTLVWAGLAYVLALITFVTGVGNIATHLHTFSGRPEIVLVLWRASPLLGLVQLALTLAIPVLLVRSLRKPAPADAVARGEA